MFKKDYRFGVCACECSCISVNNYIRILTENAHLKLTLFLKDNLTNLSNQVIFKIHILH